MKTKFACEYCHVRHEEKDAVVLKEGDGVIVYGVGCIGAMAREVDALSKDEAALELLKEGNDSLRQVFLERRTLGLKTTARIRRRTENINLTLVKG